ncbi:MAG: diacylglycerol/polyprenol kinase family protein [Candidatus Altimarinota bacterium]
MAKKTQSIKPRIYKELLRKMVHLLELPVLLVYTIIRYYYGPQFGILVLTALLIILLEIEYVRLEYKWKLPEEINILRRHEKDNLAGNIFFIVATIICFAAFDYQIALLALLLTVFGDLMSALVGLKFGKTKIYRKKSLEGTIAGMSTNLLVGYLLLPEQPEVFIPMAVTASLVEVFTGKLDDNLTVPLAAGFIGQILIYFFSVQLTTFPGPLVSQLLLWFPF